MNVSILMPTYNRPDTIDQTLKALRDVDASGIAWEIIVVDNNSADTTREVVARHQGVLPLRYLFERAQGKNFAVQAGLRAITAGWILFVDDDITPARGWLQSYCGAVSRWPDDIVFGGPVISEPPAGVDPDLAKAAPVIGIAHLDAQLPEGPMPANRWPLGANFLIRRKAFEELGLTIDTAVGPKGASRIAGSETSIFVQLEKKNARAIYVPGARVIHRTDVDFWSLPTLERRAYAQGRGQARLMPVGKDCVRLFGIPRFLFRVLVEQWLRECWHVLTRNRVERFRSRLARFRVRGTIYEYWSG